MLHFEGCFQTNADLVSLFFLEKKKNEKKNGKKSTVSNTCVGAVGSLESLEMHEL